MQFQPGHTVGVDLGTTFSTMAMLDDEGNPVPVENEDGEAETASLLLLTEGGKVIVGPKRSRAALEDPQNIVERVKRYMGRAEFKKMFEGQEITPEFLSALILKKLRQDAEKRIGKIGNAVITVPYYFNDARRKATQDAGRIAGLNVVDIINEPTAATLTYAWKRGDLREVGPEEKDRLAMVYDLGGGTFDVTLVRYRPSHFKVLATDGDVQLGGVDWNDRLLELIADAFQAKHGVNLRESESAVQMLRFDSDQAKIVLSEQPQTTIFTRFAGKTNEITVTRAQFEQLTADLFQRTIDTAQLVLEQAEVAADQLDAIVLVGGSTLMPRVSELLQQTFGIEPYKGISPHTSVAQGAAIHAAILEAKYRTDGAGRNERLNKLLSSVKQEEVNSHGLGVVVRNPKSGKEMNYVMIPRNTPIPAESSQKFATNKADQQRISVKVVQGEAPDPAACSRIGTCRITGLPPGLPKGSPVEVTYSFDEQGRVHVRAKSLEAGLEATIQIERSGGLDDEQVQQFATLADQYVVE